MAGTQTPAEDDAGREAYEQRLRDEDKRAQDRAAGPDILARAKRDGFEVDEPEDKEGEEPVVGPLASTPIQTTYPDTIRPAIAGMIANEEPARFISRTVEDAAGILFGLGVIQGVADKGCKIGAMTTEGNMLGVVVRERGIKAEFPNGYMQYDSARIMRSGCIWVTVTAAVVAGDAAKISATGTWGKGTGTGDVPHARYDTSQPTIGGLAILRIDG